MKPELVHQQIQEPEPRIRRTIKTINTKIPQDEFTIQVIQEHEAEGYLWKWLITITFITFFTIVA